MEDQTTKYMGNMAVDIRYIEQRTKELENNAYAINDKLEEIIKLLKLIAKK